MEAPKQNYRMVCRILLVAALVLLMIARLWVKDPNVYQVLRYVSLGLIVAYAVVAILFYVRKDSFRNKSENNG
jgi:DMSO reductase anchor subunit